MGGEPTRDDRNAASPAPLPPLFSSRPQAGDDTETGAGSFLPPHFSRSATRDRSRAATDAPRAAEAPHATDEAGEAVAGPTDRAHPAPAEAELESGVGGDVAAAAESAVEATAIEDDRGDGGALGDIPEEVISQLLDRVFEDESGAAVPTDAGEAPATAEEDDEALVAYEPLAAQPAQDEPALEPARDAGPALSDEPAEEAPAAAAASDEEEPGETDLPPDAVYFPEEEFAAATEPAGDQGSGWRDILAHDAARDADLAAAVARRLELWAADLRDHGPAAVERRLDASHDRLDSLLAAVLAGYFAGAADQES